MGATSDNPLGSSAHTISVLFAIAGLRLRDKCRLAFWLPSSPEAATEDITAELSSLKQCAGDGAQFLKLIRVRKQELHGSLSRWLCVFEKDASMST